MEKGNKYRKSRKLKENIHKEFYDKAKNSN